MKLDKLSELVPTVDFYGGDDEWATSALLHSEPLIERSRQHAWRIRPHRHNALAQVFWLVQGSGTGIIDSQHHELVAPCMLVVPELCVHEFLWRDGADGYAVSIASVLTNALRQEIGFQGEVLKSASVIMAADDHAFVDTLFRQLHEEYISEHPLKEFALDNIIRTIAIWILRHTVRRKMPEYINRAAFHHSRFEELVGQHHRQQWSVSKYAAELGITAPHLNAICQQMSGASALKLVHERLLLAARRELTYTDKSIAEVASSLGFSEPSYFTRFFKLKMQMTPKSYRMRSGTLSGQVDG